ncbi:MAG: hypothetical protein ACFFG0_48450, partial [Candidatus Thorarchaeota archaeon]
FNNISDLIKARVIFETCLTILKSAVEPRNNEYIYNINCKYHSYEEFEKNLANSLVILDVMQLEFEKVERKMEFMNNPVFPIKIKAFKDKLVDCMENLVLNPLLFALRNTLELITNKDFDDFCYQLFREMYSSVKIKGMDVRQKVATASGSLGATFHETYYERGSKQRKKQNFDEENYSDTTPPEYPEYPEDKNPYDGLFMVGEGTEND